RGVDEATYVSDAENALICDGPPVLRLCVFVLLSLGRRAEALASGSGRGHRDPRPEYRCRAHRLEILPGSQTQYRCGHALWRMDRRYGTVPSRTWPSARVRAQIAICN